MRIIFVYLKSFSGTGGIESYSKSFIKCLQELGTAREHDIEIFSLHDDKPDKKYVCKAAFFSFNGNKIRFIFNVLKSSYSADIVFIGHLNLSILGILIHLLNKNVKLALLIFGIEAWNNVCLIKNYFVNKCFKIISISDVTRMPRGGPKKKGGRRGRRV